MRDYRYKVSVVMAVYNVEHFIREAIDSVIAQDIGFENIQLILVDDGSPDGSGAICDEYASQYPQNVTVIHKENGGLSSSRNAGIKVATGKYVSFFDPDDILDTNVFSKVYTLFEEHNELDVVSIPIIMFGNNTGEHPLNIKFEKGTRVIDLKSEWWLPQLSLATAFLRTDVARQYAFDIDLKMPAGEDAHELIRILPLTCKLGVVADVWYHYRRHGDSLIGTSQQKKSWYTQNLHDLHIFSINYCFEHFGYLPKFVQFTLMYDLQWKLLQPQPICNDLTEADIKEYQHCLFDLFKYFDDDVILAQKSILTEHKSFALYKKYNAYPQMVAYKQDSLYLYGGSCVAFSASTLAIHVQFVKIETDRIILEGWYPYYLLLDKKIPHLVAVSNGGHYPCTIFPQEYFRTSAGTDVYQQIAFSVSVPLRQSEKAILSLERCTPYGTVKLNNLILSGYFPVSNQYSCAYYSCGNWVLQFKNNSFHVVKKPNSLLLYETRFLKEIWVKNRKGGKRAVYARLLYHFLKHLKRKKIWLIADKANRADDNGEAFFRYCCQNCNKDVLPVFLIGKKSPDYQRLKKSEQWFLICLGHTKCCFYWPTI